MTSLRPNLSLSVALTACVVGALGASPVSALSPKSPRTSTKPALQDTLPRQGLGWSVATGVGLVIPSFGQRVRFDTDMDSLIASKRLVQDQPWSGSDQGLGLRIETAWRFASGLRLAGNADWTSWGNAALARQASTGRVWEHTYRVDQVVFGLGGDWFVTDRLLKLDGGKNLYVGASWLHGLGRLEGMGRTWAEGSGQEFHLGAEVVRWGSLGLEGRLQWMRLDMQANSTWGRVQYLLPDASKANWNGSALRLEAVLRFGERPRKRLPVVLNDFSDMDAPEDSVTAPLDSTKAPQRP